MKQFGLSREQIKAATRRMRSVYRGVYALGDLDELGWLRAATLIAPGAVLSHGSALALLALRDQMPVDLHITLPSRNGPAERHGLVIHRPRRSFEWGEFKGIPVTSPAQSLKDSRLEPHELFHALDRAQNLGYDVTLPPSAVVRLQQVTRGRTRSEAEARLLLLCHERGIEPPLVNHHLNGIETDFHWPQARLVVEVDGYEFHKERPQFEEDRRRGMVHAAAGWTVIRISASQVRDTPDLVVAAIRRASDDRAPRSKKRAKRPK